jgi:nicotinate-nucleotide adenylyltransferase
VRVGVFGGTFDPVHVGHLAIAQAALECVPLDRIVFVPARRAPLKERGPAASAADRLAMVRLATADEPRFGVSTLELDREGPSYTVVTLERLRDEGELYLILGADAAGRLDGWERADRIRELAVLLVASRPGTPDPVASERLILLDAPCLDISSRELRARAARGRSLRYLVPDAARRYLEAHALYRTTEEPPRTTT